MPVIPPLLAAFSVGGLLALAGGVMQSVLRNPLAEPYMLGITGGASLFAAAAIHWGFAAQSPFVLPLAALLGAIVSLTLVGLTTALAARRRPPLLAETQLNNPGNVVILAGFVTASFTCSLQMLLLTFAAPETFATLSHWLFGDLRNVQPTTFIVATIVLFAVLSGLLGLAKYLDVLALGIDRAECLGVNTRRLIAAALLLASLATAVAVATAGAIGFIGLIVPHIARRLAGERHRRALPVAALLGGLALAVAEAIGGLLPGELSSGIVCALLGAPVFFGMLIGCGLK